MYQIIKNIQTKLITGAFERGVDVALNIDILESTSTEYADFVTALSSEPNLQTYLNKSAVPQPYGIEQIRKYIPHDSKWFVVDKMDRDAIISDDLAPNAWVQVNGVPVAITPANLKTSVQTRNLEVSTAIASDMSTALTGVLGTAVSSVSLPQDITGVWSYGDVWPGNTPGPTLPDSNGITATAADKGELVLTWPTAFINANYGVKVTITGDGIEQVGFNFGTKTTTGITINLTQAVAASQDVIIQVQASDFIG